MREVVKQRIADAKAAGFKRPLYYRDGDTRPALRGQFFAAFKWQWTTLVAVYFVATSMASVQQPEFVLIRAFAALSYIMLVFVGDKYHNSDVNFIHFSQQQTSQGDAQLDRSAVLSPLHYELYWLRWDFLTIALIQASTFQVWVAHYGYIEGHVLAAALLWTLCLLVVLVSVLFLDTNRDPTTVYDVTGSPNALNAIKALLGTQFVTYMYLVSTGPVGCSWTAGIYYIFIPGFIAYAARFPEDGPRFGAHELFHAFIVLGIFSSMFCDAANISFQCAAR